MTKRKSLSKKVRFEVFKRDEFTCQYCGNTPPKVILEADHIKPVAEGGDNSIDNLICSCFDCNRGKGARPLSSIPLSIKEKAKKLVEAEAQIKAFYDLASEKRSRLEIEAWKILEIYEPGIKDFDSTDFQTLIHFLEKLGFPDVLSAMHMAVAKERRRAGGAFRYFCGICWNFIKGNKY